MKQKHTRSRLTYLTCALFFLALLSVAHAADPAPISATELWKAYETDPAAADKVYKGKTIVVTGSVYFAGVNPISQAINVTLKDDEGKDRIACTFPASAKAAVTALKEDDKVTIKGTGAGPLFTMGVNLKDCELVKH